MKVTNMGYVIRTILEHADNLQFHFESSKQKTKKCMDLSPFPNSSDNPLDLPGFHE